LDKLPKTTLQALYHAVTGKTETYSKSLRRNVVIRFADIDRLNQQIRQQIEHYQLVSDPTITVVVKTDHNQRSQYSSWERFSNFQTNSTDLTSEIILKYEFLIQLPNTPAPQRCIVTVALDSGLPMLPGTGEDSLPDSIIIFFGGPGEWQSVRITIDFVDFLIARVFTSVIEAWFQSLEKTECPDWARFCQRHFERIGGGWRHISTIGLACFLATFAYTYRGEISIKDVLYLVAISLVAFVALKVVFSFLETAFNKNLSSMLVPSAILITEGDKRCYNKVLEPRNSFLNSIWKIIIAAVSAVTLNIVASYVYAVMAS
jgi:hypothetical protein